MRKLTACVFQYLKKELLMNAHNFLKSCSYQNKYTVKMKTEVETTTFQIGVNKV
jgi:hypothetical protein